MTRAAIIIIVLAVAGIAHSRTKTSTHPLTSAEKEVEMIADIEQPPGDTIPQRNFFCDQQNQPPHFSN